MTIVNLRKISQVAVKNQNSLKKIQENSRTMPDDDWDDAKRFNNNNETKNSGWTHPRQKAWSSKLPPKISEDLLNVEAKQ